VREYVFAQPLQGVMYILGRCSTRPSWRGPQQINLFKFFCFFVVDAQKRERKDEDRRYTQGGKEERWRRHCGGHVGVQR
jgi:hypothetical protein